MKERIKPTTELSCPVCTRPLTNTEIRIIGASKTIREQVLQASKDRLQLCLKAAQLGSWEYDPFHRLFSWDTRSKEIFGVTGNGVTVEEFMSWVHPDDAERVWAAFFAALDPAEPKRSTTEFRLRLQDGGFRWVETLGLAHFQGAGRRRRAVSAVGTVADITERKERQERERLLMCEINHRAKNMLCVVDAIARARPRRKTRQISLSACPSAPGAFSQSGSARPERMARGRDRAPGSGPACAFQRSR